MPKKVPLSCAFSCGDDGTRTHDPLLAKQHRGCPARDVPYRLVSPRTSPSRGVCAAPQGFNRPLIAVACCSVSPRPSPSGATGSAPSGYVAGYVDQVVDRRRSLVPGQGVVPNDPPGRCRPPGSWHSMRDSATSLPPPTDSSAGGQEARPSGRHGATRRPRFRRCSKSAGSKASGSKLPPAHSSIESCSSWSGSPMAARNSS